MTRKQTRHWLLRRRWRLSFEAVAVALPLISLGLAVFGVIDLNAALAASAAAVLLAVGALTEVLANWISMNTRPLQAYKNDFDAKPAILQVIEERPATADFLDYSGHGALELLARLFESKSTSRVRLLVGHPEAAPDYQRESRLLTALTELSYRVPDPRAIGLVVKCYRSTPSLRGRLIDERLLTVGWYLYHRRDLPDPARMSGGTNPSVSVEADSPNWQPLSTMYKAAFEDLWHDGEPLASAWEPHRGAFRHMPAADWLRSASEDVDA